MESASLDTPSGQLLSWFGIRTSVRLANGEVKDLEYTTKFGSLDQWEKGRIEIIDGDPKHYAFSNVYEVASNAKPWEKTIVGLNRQYVLEAIRAEGTSQWRTAPHDEFALVMDGEVEIRLYAIDNPRAYHQPDELGSRVIDGEPSGKPMGVIRAKKGHMALLPADRAYQFRAEQPAVIVLQSIKSPDSLERWAEICISTV